MTTQLVKQKATHPDLIEITPAMYAEQRNWSRWRAWKHFRRLEERHGERAIKRRGRVLYTTREGLKAVGEHWDVPTDPRVLRRLADLEAFKAETEGRINGMAHELSEFKRKANEWFKRAK